VPVYYLEPKDEGLSDPRWTATALKEGCWVRADTEDLARTVVDHATHTMVARKQGWPLLFSPWRDPTLTDCRLETPNVIVPRGIIVTRGGKTFS
jgi:hypothetical protein